MFKSFIFIIMAMFLVSCSSTTPRHKAKPKIFQSVNKKEAILVKNDKVVGYCYICGNDLKKYYKTNHIAREHSKEFQYCSIHCLAKHVSTGIKLGNIGVVDTNSLKFIQVSKAYYVVGSSVPGTNTKVSKYAFSSIEEAIEFRRNLGGRVFNFNKAFAVAKEDFK